MARSFAHLVGLGRRASAPAPRAAEETEDEKRERETAEQRDRDQEARRMEDNGEDTGETEEEREERHKREAASRRASAATEEGEDEDGDDDGDKEEMRGHGTIARARSRERGRIGAILSSPQAAANLPLAVDLACNTTMSRDEAVRVLARAPAPARADRSARNPTVGSGRSVAAGSPGSHSEIQTMWGEALARTVPAMRNAQRR